MTVPDLVCSKNNRFSSNSCVTEESIDSVTLMTPLDASPLPPPFNAVPIINIVNDDPFPNSTNYPAIASAYYNRHRAQTSSPLPTEPIQQQTLLQPSSSISIPIDDTKVKKPKMSKMTRLWPKIKYMMVNSSSSSNKVHTDNKFKQLFDSMNISSSTRQKIYNKRTSSTNNKRWRLLGRKNKSRIDPQQ
ncbi:uncharacterized protein BX663DRAFT_428469 [Cokeromyces recurvatus]|uniref:uncharacterized protein n=1 Tax=Cokeromyces recurvatus TaxID=90255 RepID=UPI00221F154D|nr:uncharacterized protein BX663DRAFT_428469 [Cokeromyces recurvatus]KAI7905991.1 hypothetical protein BX663DRAFT_428469 [Cokeromyces recurvatus]